MAQRYAGHRYTGLQAFLDDLGFKGFGIGSSLAHGNPDNKGDGVHVFLGGEHRPYRWDRIGDFGGRLPLREVVVLLMNKSDLVSLLRSKVRAAVIDKKPYLESL